MAEIVPMKLGSIDRVESFSDTGVLGESGEMGFCPASGVTMDSAFFSDVGGSSEVFCAINSAGAGGPNILCMPVPDFLRITEGHLGAARGKLGIVERRLANLGPTAGRWKFWNFPRCLPRTQQIPRNANNANPTIAPTVQVSIFRNRRRLSSRTHSTCDDRLVQ